MKLYNTLSRQIEEIRPLNPPVITVYTCGPTVYDYAHIGHWFNYVRMDSLIRVLNNQGLTPKWVMNITDVGHLVSDADEGEDKLEKGARREGKTAWQVAEYYTADFFEGMKLLNISQPTHIPKATDHIKEQIELIQILEQKGYTYIIDDGVYYDTAMFEGYAAFARLDLNAQQAGARVNFNRQKRNVSDFALWKFSPKDHKRDMEWDSPWGKGFPGWHIECSAMSMKYLGSTLDIHTGGIDHIPVHHTNEIAQSEAATGKRFANYWLHSNHVTVNGEKISKSLGNGIRLQTILEKGVSAAAVRLHVLESHYRSQAKFSWENLEAAANRLAHWRQLAALAWQPTADGVTAKEINSSIKQIRAFMADDLDTPKALSEIDRLFNLIESKALAEKAVPAFNDYLRAVDNLLGISLPVEDITESERKLIHDRQLARQANDWQRADMLRDELASRGLGLKDTASGAVWFRL